MPKDAINRLNQNVNTVTGNIDRNVATTGGWLGQLDVSTRKFRDKKGSIIQSAKGNIFEFPVFISSSIPMEYAQATTSLLEQVYASYLQMAISINPVIDHTVIGTGGQFSALKSDTNRYLEYTDTMWQHDACHAIYDNEECVVEFSMISYEDTEAKTILEYVDHQPLEEFAHFFGEAFNPKTYPNKKGQKSEATADIDNSNIDVTQFGRGYYGKKPKNTTTPASTSGDKANGSGNGKKGPTTPAGTSGDVANGTEPKKDRVNQKLLKFTQKSVKDNKAKDERIKTLENRADTLKNQRDKAQKELDDLKSKRQEEADKRDKAADDRAKAKHEKEMEKLDQEIKKNQNILDNNEKEIAKLDQEIKRNEREAKWDTQDRSLRQADLANRARINAPKFISEKDIEKLNTMKPLLMNVDLNVKADNGTLSPVSYIVGVKTYNRIIDADTIPDVAEYPLKEMNKVLRKAKWRAGELKFFSDIVFRIKQKKQNAIDKKDPKRKWYRRLYELAHMKGDAPTTNIVNGGTVIGTLVMDKMGKTKSAHGVIPNVSLLISKTDVDICKMKTGIDLLNAHTASSLCKELFLMALVVEDTDNETLKILLPDLHNDFDVHSLASVNRQIASLDSSGQKTRDIFKMLNR